MVLKNKNLYFSFKIYKSPKHGGEGRIWEESGLQSFEWCMEECFGTLHYLNKATEKYAPNLSWSKLLCCSMCSCVAVFRQHIFLFWTTTSAVSLYLWETYKSGRSCKDGVRGKKVWSQFFEIIQTLLRTEVKCEWRPEEWRENGWGGGEWDTEIAGKITDLKDREGRRGADNEGASLVRPTGSLQTSQRMERCNRVALIFFVSPGNQRCSSTQLLSDISRLGRRHTHWNILQKHIHTHTHKPNHPPLATHAHRS